MMVTEDPGLQPTALCNELQLSPSTITRLIEKLENKKLVVRTREGKITNVYPTPKGKELLPQLRECLEHFYQQYSGILGKEESTRIVHIMNRVADRL